MISNPVAWDPLRLARLEALAKQTDPWLTLQDMADTLAEEYGLSFTMSSVVSTLARYGIRRAPHPPGRGNSTRPKVVPMRPQRETPQAPTAPRAEAPSAFAHLTDAGCQWMLTQPARKGFNAGLRFCGATCERVFDPISGRTKRRSYCPEHARRIYVTAVPAGNDAMAARQ